jgi:hypothetical protein
MGKSDRTGTGRSAKSTRKTKVTKKVAKRAKPKKRAARRRSNEDPILDAPFAKRRGTLKAWDYNDWQAVGVHAGGPGGIDGVCDKLAKVEKVGVVERDVTKEALAGKLPGPDAPHVLLVKMKGHDWALAAGSWINRASADELAEQLSREAGVRAIACGHGDTASATYFQMFEGGKSVIEFESCGEGFGEEADEPPSRWNTKRYPKSWLAEHEDENEALQALVRDQGAYLPMFDISSENGRLSLFAYPEDALDPKNVERVALVVYGPASAARPSPAGQQLADAIKNGDAAAVRAAIEAGASLEFLPGVNGTALSYAVGYAEDAESKRVEVLRTLIDAGADPNDGGTEGPPIFEPFDSIGWEPHQAIPVLAALLDARADVNARSTDLLYRGQTPFHIAASSGKLALVKFLHARGADLRANDPQRRTPRKVAEESLKFTEENFEGVGDEHTGQLRAVIDYLKRAEAGSAPEGDWDELAGKDKAREERRRRELTKSFADIGAALKQFGAVTGAKNKKEAARAAAGVATLSQPDKIKVRQVPDDAKWDAPKVRDTTVKALRGQGFERAGTFVVEQFPGCRMVLLVHPERHAYGLVSEMATFRWVNVVQYYTDGSSLTVTNARSHEAAQVDAPKLRKLREPKMKAAQLVERLFAERLPEGARVQEITAAEFPARFERHYALEMWYRKKVSRGDV